MSEPSRITRTGQIAAAVGWSMALLAAAYLVFAVAVALIVPGHWSDVAKIAGVCFIVSSLAVWLIRTGRPKKVVQEQTDEEALNRRGTPTER
jgi:hypothetical protein